MSIKICLVALAALCLVPCVAAQESTYNVTDFLQLWGYKYDLYTSNTADGYVLGLQRIYSTTGSTLGHVILQHGLLDTAATWLLNDPEESLGYMLADAGYDVWLANSRGNTYSPCSNYSWDWDQHAQFDVPAVIQTVQSVTGSKSVYFIGHSQGATIGVAAFSTQPKVAANVKLFIALAPVTYLASQRSTLLSTLASLHVDQLLLALPDGPMILTPQLLSHFLGLACTVTPSLCNNILNSLFGSDSNLNMSRMDVYTGHWPDQTSTRNMAHWIQNARSGAFASLSGANYQPSSIACPVAVFGGTQDFLADSADVNTLVAAMGSKVVYKNLGLNYGHMDFVWGQNANTNVYQFVIALLQKYK